MAFVIDFREIPFSAEDLRELEFLRLDFVFQPILYAESLKVVAYEALMRPQGMSPLELIEEYQKKDKLYVIEIATCFGATLEYRKRGYTQNICLNSFPSEVLTREQIDMYFECFPEMEDKIIVEMVEYTELNKHNWAMKKLEIKDHGMKVALDDYSTGNNDKSAVEYFEPHYVKLDRSLISGIHLKKGMQQNIIELVKEFHDKGIEVVAEGIEEKAELDFLRDQAKVDYVQGYYLGRPQ